MLNISKVAKLRSVRFVPPGVSSPSIRVSWRWTTTYSAQHETQVKKNMNNI